MHTYILQIYIYGGFNIFRHKNEGMPATHYNIDIDLEDIYVSEINKTENIYYIISLICGI